MTTTATTAFQVIFDLAESIAIDRRGIVAQTTTRNNSVRAISRGGQVWRFTVKLPDGLSWSAARRYIEAIDAADRSTTGLVSLSNTNYTSWLSAYQGSSVNSTGFTANTTQGNTTLTLTASPTTASGYKFRAGDLIQLGTTGHAYSVVSDVAFNSNTVTLNRAVIGTSGSYNLQVGPAVTWRVLCTNMPTWTIFARDQVSWSGAFEFVEALNDY